MQTYLPGPSSGSCEKCLVNCIIEEMIGLCSIIHWKLCCDVNSDAFLFLAETSSQFSLNGPIIPVGRFVKDMDHQSDSGYTVRSWVGKNWWSFHSKIGAHKRVTFSCCDVSCRVIVITKIGELVILRRRLVYESSWCTRLLRYSIFCACE